jgi:hypothetical protein
VSPKARLSSVYSHILHVVSIFAYIGNLPDDAAPRVAYIKIEIADDFILCAAIVIVCSSLRNVHIDVRFTTVIESVLIWHSAFAHRINLLSLPICLCALKFYDI